MNNLAKKGRKVLAAKYKNEPTFDSGVSDVTHAFNYYTSHDFSKKEAFGFFLDYLKSLGVSKKDMERVALIDPSKLDIPTYGFLARMKSRGATLPKEYEEKLGEKVNLAKELSLKVAGKKDAKSKRRHEKLRLECREFIGFLEEEIDNFLNKFSSDFDPCKWAKGQETLKTHQAKYIVSHFEPIHKEVLRASEIRLKRKLNSEDDEQIKESYSGFSKKNLEAYASFLESIIKGVSSQRKKVGRTASNKPKKLGKREDGSMLQYKKEDFEFSLKSKPASKLLGASEAWLFKCDSRELTRLVALEGGFTVSGSSLRNVNLDKSVRKRLRKPKEVLPKILGLTQKTSSNMMNRIATKEAVARTNLTNETIILKVF